MKENRDVERVQLSATDSPVPVSCRNAQEEVQTKNTVDMVAYKE